MVPALLPTGKLSQPGREKTQLEKKPSVHHQWQSKILYALVLWTESNVHSWLYNPDCHGEYGGNALHTSLHCHPAISPTTVAAGKCTTIPLASLLPILFHDAQYNDSCQHPSPHLSSSPMVCHLPDRNAPGQGLVLDEGIAITTLRKVGVTPYVA